VTGPRALSDGRRGDESVLSDVQAKAALAFVVAVFVAVGFHFKLLKLIPIAAAAATAVLGFAFVRRAVSPLVGLYAACAVVVAAAFPAWTDRRALARFAAWFGAVFGAGVALATGLAILAAVVSFSSVHPYYFLLCAPFLCVVAGDAVLSLLAWLRVRAGPAAVAAAVATIALGAFDVRRAREIVARQSLPQAAEIAGEVRRLSDPGDTVFGDADVAPLVALLADHGIVDRHVDTNAKVYVTGVDDLAAVRRTLSAPWRGVVVVRDIRVDGPFPIVGGPRIDDAFRELMNARFERVAEFPRPEAPGQSIVLLVQNGQPAGDGK
jgi:hypothetical protein